ncbi:MAG: B12-binding domain-containing radical SAM protein [Planctomycetes bacterium]|nr:B12-binding domain-containing radical SAM protein [Planctomycetota bacterium]
MKTNKIQLVFCPHELGQLAYEDEIQSQPPLGLLTLASYLEKHNPYLEIEVIDGKQLTELEMFRKIDADFIGFSSWFSNYKNTICAINKVKVNNPSAKIAIGGPHTSFLAKNIINNNKNIDYVFQGESEIALSNLLKGVSPKEVRGLWYNENNKINFSEASKGYDIDIDTVPSPNLDFLYPKFNWESHPESHAMSAFPISGIRGCTRNRRCEYCSIPLSGYRTKSPNAYIEQIKLLHQQYGIDFFFETGDVFTPNYLEQLAKSYSQTNIAMRIYSYPGNLENRHLKYLDAIGVNTIFMGVESTLVWKDGYRRKYKNNYTKSSLVQEINMLGEIGIKVIPSFILGLPGEDEISLKENIDLILRLKQLSNVNEVTVSIVLPLPGTLFFKQCLEIPLILKQYQGITGFDLKTSDDIDIQVLSELFVNHFTKLEYHDLYDAICKIQPEIGGGFACWSSSKSQKKDNFGIMECFNV